MEGRLKHKDSTLLFLLLFILVNGNGQLTYFMCVCILANVVTNCELRRCVHVCVCVCVIHYSEFNITCCMEIDWSNQSLDFHM